MKITFCLPSILKVPSGGFKIVFEYANRLSERGHEVSIVCLTDTHYTNYTKSDFVKNILGKFRIKGYPNWFKLRSSIKVYATPYLDGRHFPDADVVVATSARTSFIINDLPVSKGKKFYLIQDFETWGMSENKLIESYQLGLTNIVVSKWLSEIVLAKANVESKLLSNPIDTEKFFVVKPIEGRSSFEIAMLYHTGKHKGIPIAFEALERVKKEIPSLHVNLFGVFDPPELPSWITYTQKANDIQLLEIYNKSSIFICASNAEGFGLTGAESMACGCALASTAYQGVFEYAQNNINALLSDVGDSEMLAENIIKLVKNSEFRLQLAKRGSEDLKKFSWENAVDTLEIILNS